VILETPFSLEQGSIVIPAKPGVGMTWNEEAVRRYQI